jgi:hypothetical protein
MNRKNFKAHLRDIHFSFERLKVPKVSDEGYLDVDLWGEDSSIAVKWNIYYTVGQPTFKLRKCKVHLSHVQLRVTKSRHK